MAVVKECYSRGEAYGHKAVREVRTSNVFGSKGRAHGPLAHGMAFYGQRLSNWRNLLWQSFSKYRRASLLV